MTTTTVPPAAPPRSGSDCDTADDQVPGASSPLPPASALGFRLARLARTLRREWSEELATLGLTPPQAAVLRGVAGTPGCSLRASARALSTDPMNTKRCTDELEGRNLLRSGRRLGDRRSRTLTLTEPGSTLASQVNLLVLRQEQRFDTALGPTRRQQIDGALRALERAMGLPDPPASGTP